MFSRKLKRTWSLPDYGFHYWLETRPRFFKRFLRAQNPSEWTWAQCWVNLGWLIVLLESLVLLWIWNQVKPGSFDRFFTSILKVKVWFVVEPYGAREKKLHTDSLDEGRIYNFTLTLLLMYLQIQFLK